MGLGCSDTKNRSKCIPTVERFCSFTEISDFSCNASYYTVRNREGGRVDSYSHPARLEYYDHNLQLKTRYVTKEITLKGAGRTRKTVTISDLKVTRNSSSEQTRFRNERDSAGPTYSDHDGTLGWSPTSTAIVRSDVPHISSHISKITSEEKPEISLISQSLVFPPEGSKVKNYEAETTSNNLGTNDSPVSLGYVTNIKLSEIPALRECRSLSVPEEQT